MQKKIFKWVSFNSSCVLQVYKHRSAGKHICMTYMMSFAWWPVFPALLTLRVPLRNIGKDEVTTTRFLVKIKRFCSMFFSLEPLKLLFHKFIANFHLWKVSFFFSFCLALSASFSAQEARDLGQPQGRENFVLGWTKEQT